MKKDQIILLKDRGLISITGDDAKNFLQNIITNDIEKINNSCSVFSALLTPQGKYLFEFFLIKSKDGFLLDCDGKATNEIINYLTKYKLRSKIEIKDKSNEYIVGVISLEKFNEIRKSENKQTDTIEYRSSSIFIDSRNKKLGARILSTLEKLYLTIKKLKLKITKPEVYFSDAHILGVPVKGVESLKEKLFSLEANFEELSAIDFKKGCYIGQENTARMKLKNKLRRRLLPIETQDSVKIGDELKFKNTTIGKVLIDGATPFALVKLFDPDFTEFSNKEILINNKKAKLINIFT